MLVSSLTCMIFFHVNSTHAVHFLFFLQGNDTVLPVKELIN